jgi:hypothetical protein
MIEIGRRDEMNDLARTAIGKSHPWLARPHELSETAAIRESRIASPQQEALMPAR